jgi:PLP dependent protein
MPYSDLAARVQEVRTRIVAAVARGGHGQTVRIVAVTKTHGPDAVEAAFAAGLTDIGENKVQEAMRKMAAVVAPVSWHLIGHLQRNKAREAGRFALIHSLDSARLAAALDTQATRQGRRLDVLVQVNASREETKGGFSADEIAAVSERLHDYRGLRVVGVMTMSAPDVGERELRDTFTAARDARATLSAGGHEAQELSMGMSQDYEIAVEEGATLVRLGTTLFGPRGE